MNLTLATSSGTPANSGDTEVLPLEIKGPDRFLWAKTRGFLGGYVCAARAMTAIVGPNGAGKSTLLKAALGIIKPLAGQIRSFGKPIVQSRDRIAYVPQRASVDWDFPTRVLDVALMGLFPSWGCWVGSEHIIGNRQWDASERVGMEDFAYRQIGQLSGGQQQRVFSPGALVQDADLYVLDEPFAGVDAATEKAIIDVLKGLRDSGKTVVAVHHDLNTVADYFDRVFLINTRKVAEGPVRSSFTVENLQAAYGGRLAAAHMDSLHAAAD